MPEGVIVPKFDSLHSTSNNQIEVVLILNIVYFVKNTYRFDAHVEKLCQSEEIPNE